MQTALRKNDRRTAVRIDFQTRASIHSPDGRELVTGVLRNISVVGILVDAEFPGGELDNSYLLNIYFQGKSSRLVIEDLTCILMRIDQGGCAFRFTEPLEWSLLFHVYRKRAMRRFTGR